MNKKLINGIISVTILGIILGFIFGGNTEYFTSIFPNFKYIPQGIAVLIRTGIQISIGYYILKTLFHNFFKTDQNDTK